MVIERINSLYSKYESHLSSLFLVGGFVFDILTLRRVDNFFENFVIVLYFIITASIIIVLNRNKNEEENKDSRLDFWLLNLLQFSLGGLLSAFLVLYFRSATLSVSWPFLLLLLLSFIANERLKHHYQRLVYQVSFLFLALLLFSIFSLPVVFGLIGPLIFILSGLVSLLFVWLYLGLLNKISVGKVRQSMKMLWTSIALIFGFVNVLYFTNIIPPLPLSLKEGDIYHYVVKDGMGNYNVIAEEKSWLNYFKIREQVTSYPGESLYAYTAIFSPAKFNTSIIHRWQSYDSENGRWVTFSKITLNTSGGRDNGYRTYSASSVTPGIWRVEVLTLNGQVLGRIGFEVKYAQIPPKLITEVH